MDRGQYFFTKANAVYQPGPVDGVSVSACVCLYVCVYV